MTPDEKIKMLKETLEEVIANEKDYKNCTELSVWTRSKINNTLRKL